MSCYGGNDWDLALLFIKFLLLVTSSTSFPPHSPILVLALPATLIPIRQVCNRICSGHIMSVGEQHQLFKARSCSVT